MARKKTNGEFVIERDVPLPRPANKWPFAQMEVGDSFMLHNEKEYRAAHAVARMNGMKITVRKVDGGVRVWRIA